MIQFEDFFTLITESSKSGTLKTHLSHIEDLILEEGLKGFIKFKEQIDEFLKFIKGLDSNTDINLKVDGAPALYFGYDTRKGYEGDFFVATKSGFNERQLINHNDLDVEKNHPKSLGLQFVLKQALHYLKPLYEKIAPEIGNRMVQTDFLFRSRDDRSIEMIDGQEYVTFHPQLIKYAIPVDGKSDIYHNVRNAEIGIAIHDLWDAPSQDNRIRPVTNKPKEPAAVDRFVEEGKKHSVFVVNSMYTPDTIKLNVGDDLIQKIEDLLNRAHMEIEAIPEDHDSRFFPEMPEDEQEKKEAKAELKHELNLVSLFRIFINNEVRHAAQGEKNIYEHALRGGAFNDSYFNVTIRKFLSDRRIREVAKRKSSKGQAGVEEMFSVLEDLKTEFKLYVKATYHLIEIKHYLVEIFDKVDTSLKIGKSFYPEGDGYKLDKGEGFVLFVDDNHVKVVDRIAFSGRNLLSGKFQR